MSEQKEVRFMYCFILKDCVPPKKIVERGDFELEGKTVNMRFISGIGQKEAVKTVLDYLIGNNFIIPANEESYNQTIENANEVYIKNSPYTLVVVKSEFDEEYPYDLLLSLSLFQGYPAKLFALIKIEGNKPVFSFYPERRYKYSNNTLFLPDTDEDYETIIENAKHNRFVIELLYEANSEGRLGMKIAKYFTILELLSQKFSGNHKVDKIEELFKKFQFNQMFVRKHSINMSQITYNLSSYYKKMSLFTSMDILYMFRNVVVHDGIMHPPEFVYFFNSDNIKNSNKITPLEELELGVNMIVKTILRDSIDVQKMHQRTGFY